MERKRKLSIAAEILIILLSLRILSNIYLIVIALLTPNFISILYSATTCLLLVLYIVALIGVIKKTVWGLNFVTIVATLDIILGIFLSLVLEIITYEGVLGLIGSVILILLARRISKRIKK